ncbi:Iron-sulfur cluster-binding domain-containing protein [Pseudobutyrivibrio sp. ACV-2]|uniref:radical SAM/SPASM domain-containing protein n=1 Tax=Pseudobutyrivibrio sp. ACV-2 TaxID=1520801 RepID=UPI0008976672|nr:radical SAM/SPASM domain-containing protein [Pseudobutyrivibrio sp. ACV-2]SEA10771.1 Iron-sulfur cluster-binding domain-containing protein [Pseudobutyrivibrio sp. ACV-2]
MKIVVFGAGIIGKQAVSMYKSKVAYIVDNNKELQGKNVDGIQIKPVEVLLDDCDYKVLIASRNVEMMKKQLDKLGVTNYEYFVSDPRAYYSTNEIVFNPYDGNSRTEESEKERIRLAIDTINANVEELHDKVPLFDHVEIETINRCNGVCAFCPVNRNQDPREYAIMSELLFKKIIDELSELDYQGKLACFSNNEPFLDPNIIDRLKYAREKLPKARMHLFTNGTLLTLEKFLQVVDYLDELIIDNYNQELELISNNKIIAAYCENHPELINKVTIVLRKSNEVLSSRGGDAPNHEMDSTFEDVRCALPFKQLIIRPTGEVSLCCNDPLGRDTLGDLSTQSLKEVWYGKRFNEVREALYKGRGNWPHCKYCDTINIQ